MARHFITLAVAADYLAVDQRTIRRFISAGDLTGYRIGKRTLRVDASELERLAHPIPTAG